MMMKVNKSLALCSFLFLFLLLLYPSTGFAWSTPTYTEIWSEPTYTDIWSEPVYTDIWSEPSYTDVWSEENTVYYELEEGNVTVTVTPTIDDSYYVLYRSTNFNDFVELTGVPITTPYYEDTSALAGNTYIYVFASYDEYDNLIGYSNFVVVKVIPAKVTTPIVTTPIPEQTPTVISTPAHKTIVLELGNKNATIDGVQKTLNVAPVTVNGRTLVPLRFISESMGANVNWNEKEKKITIILNGKTIVLWLNKSEAYIGQNKIVMDVPPKLVNAYTFVPIRFISENFGQEVTYDKNTRKITIKAGVTNSKPASQTPQTTTSNNYFVGTWDLWVPGGYNTYTGYYTPGAGGDTLTIKNDGTFQWIGVNGKTINGNWSKDGSNIKILSGRYEWDWTVSEAQFSDGKGIKVYTTGTYYEGRKR